MKLIYLLLNLYIFVSPIKTKVPGTDIGLESIVHMVMFFRIIGALSQVGQWHDMIRLVTTLFIRKKLMQTFLEICVFLNRTVFRLIIIFTHIK